jgi:hypothetical protein
VAGCTFVGAGDAVEVAGFEVHVHGELHAEIHPEIPRTANVGFLVAGQVFHPGDALTVPGEPVTTLLLPCTHPGRRSPNSSTTCVPWTPTRRTRSTTGSQRRRTGHREQPARRAWAGNADSVEPAGPRGRRRAVRPAVVPRGSGQRTARFRPAMPA